MSPEYVRPYVKAQKNDDRDAEAIAEAATRPTKWFIALKTEAQLDEICGSGSERRHLEIELSFHNSDDAILKARCE